MVSPARTWPALIQAVKDTRAPGQDYWTRASAYQKYGANAIIAEVNQGGDMIEHTLKSTSPTITFKSVRAKANKYDRAIPVASLYKQGKIHHARKFDALEEQMQNFTPESTSSPDRMDALVWGFLELFFDTKQQAVHIEASYV